MRAAPKKGEVGRTFDSELDCVIEVLASETTMNLMAFYLHETTSPSVIARSIQADPGSLAIHTGILLDVGAIEKHGDPRETLRTGQFYRATELGQIAYMQTADRDGSESHR
jgi:DNA-binding MarR family transcriptional regulator